MIEFEIHNFQSIRHVTMVVSGFTAIVGKSNIGKSAIVRAVQYALTGAPGTDFVRHGPTCDRRARGTKKCKCAAKVRVKTSAIEILWEKGDQINRYTVKYPDGRSDVFDGLDRGTPHFLLPEFAPVKVGEHKELIQIPDQFTPIFLLNQSGPAVADILSDVARLEAINKAMAMVVKDRKDATARRKVREEDIQSLQESLVRYTGLDAVSVKPVGKDIAALQKRQQLLKDINGYLTVLAGIKTGLLSLNAALQPAFPDEGPLTKLSARYLQVQGFWDSLAEKGPVIKQLKGVDKVEVPDETVLQKKHADLQKAVGLLQRLEVTETAVGQLAPAEAVAVPEVSSLEELNTQLVRSEAFLNRSQILDKEIGRCELASNTPELEWGPLQNILGQVSQVQGFLDRFRVVGESLKATQASLKAAVDEERAVLEECAMHGVCPTCTQPIGASHTLHAEAV